MESKERVVFIRIPKPDGGDGLAASCTWVTTSVATSKDKVDGMMSSGSVLQTGYKVLSTMQCTRVPREWKLYNIQDFQGQISECIGGLPRTEYCSVCRVSKDKSRKCTAGLPGRGNKSQDTKLSEAWTSHAMEMADLNTAYIESLLSRWESCPISDSRWNQSAPKAARPVLA